MLQGCTGKNGTIIASGLFQGDFQPSTRIFCKSALTEFLHDNGAGWFTKIPAVQYFLPLHLIAAFFTIMDVSLSLRRREHNAYRVTPTAPTSTPTFLPTATLPPPTPMVTLSGGVSQNDEEKDAGVILLAMETGPHRQIYAYHPLYLSMSRVTNGDWDYDDPSISPDGRKIAYCANQSGVWEIYILDLISGTEPGPDFGGYAVNQAGRRMGNGGYEQMVEINDYLCVQPRWRTRNGAA